MANAKPNLPPQSAEWGRQVDKKLSAAELMGKNLSTLVNGVRASLSSLSSAVGFLKEQTTIVETAPGAFSNFSTTLESASDNTYVYMNHNPLWDAVLEFTTSSSGKIIYQAGCSMVSWSNNYSHCETRVGVEIYKGNSDFSADNRVMYATSGGPILGTRAFWNQTQVAGMGHHHQITLAPNTLYTARTIRFARHSYDTSIGGVQSAMSSWQGASLLITKIGK